MPPYSGPPNPRRWTSPLQVDGRPVFDDDGYTLSKYGFEVLLGWVKQGNLTDLGMQAVKDGWWVDPGRGNQKLGVSVPYFIIQKITQAN